ARDRGGVPDGDAGLRRPDHRPNRPHARPSRCPIGRAGGGRRAGGGGGGRRSSGGGGVQRPLRPDSSGCQGGRAAGVGR
ncbi:MAG: hypothetical protein AVDCRST_MAG19-2419, partial [uncultured Thermomicrobiales bacterium]